MTEKETSAEKAGNTRQQQEEPSDGRIRMFTDFRNSFASFFAQVLSTDCVSVVCLLLEPVRNIKEKFPDYAEELEKDPPLRNKEVANAAHCASIFYQLALHVEAGGETRPTSPQFIAELFETWRCNEVCDLSALRKSYIRYLGGDLARKVIGREPLTTGDLEVAAAAVIHYDRRTLRAVKSAFTYPQKLQWYFVEHWDETRQFILAGSAAGVFVLNNRVFIARVARSAISGVQNTGLRLYIQAARAAWSAKNGNPS